MKVHFVSHCLPPLDQPITNVGGMQRVASDLTDALASRADIQLSTSILRGTWNEIHWRAPGFMFRTLRELRRGAIAGEYDVVLYSSMVTASLAVLLKRTFRRHGVASAAIVHGLDVTMKNPLYQLFVPRVFSSLDLVLPVSRATAAACVVRGLSRRNLAIIPNGIRMDRFPDPDFGRNGEREELSRFENGSPVPENAFIVCSVGRQVERKGFSWFAANVMPLLPDDIHYVLAGDGPEADSIRESAKASGVEHRVHVLGRLTEDHLEVLYRAADVFVMPNVPIDGDMEGFGVVMLEAGLSGLPTVASKLEGIRDVVADGENGVLVKSRDKIAFAEALRKYYESPAFLKEASLRAYRYTAKSFSWATVSHMYVNVLRRLVAKTNRSG